MPPELKNDPTAEVFSRITSFAQDVSRHIRGTCQLQINRQGLVQRLYAAFRRFKTAIWETAPKFDARNESAAAAGGIDFKEPDSDDGEDLWWNDDSEIKVADVMRVATEYVFSDFVRLALTLCRARTRELPGNYPFSVKAYYIFRFLEMWEGPTFDCFEVAFKGFVEDLAVLIDEHFGLYVNGGLLSQVQYVSLVLPRELSLISNRTVVNSQLQSCAADARIVLRMEMLKETESIYTQNEHYLEAYKAKFLGHYKQVRSTLR